MRPLVLVAALTLAACGSSADSAYTSGLIATNLGVTACRTTVTRHVDAAGHESYSERVDYVALGMFGQVVTRGDGNPCGSANEPLPVTLADGTRISVVRESLEAGAFAVATDRDGVVRWRVLTPIVGVLLGAHDAGHIYLTDGQDVASFDSSNGTLLWQHTL